MTTRLVSFEISVRHTHQPNKNAKLEKIQNTKESDTPFLILQKKHRKI